MGHNRAPVEQSVRSHFDWVIFDGEYSALSIIAEIVANWAPDGAYEKLRKRSVKCVW